MDLAIERHLSTSTEELGHTHAACAVHGLAWLDGEVVYDKAHGVAQCVPNQREFADPNAPIFDLASVTKSLVTSTLAMIAVDRGWIKWTTPISDIFPAWETPRRDTAPNTSATFLTLLNHSSGLPAWHKFYEEYPFDLDAQGFIAQRQTIIERILKWERKFGAGTHYEYSDLGYILLCAILERVFARHTDTCRYLDEIAHEEIFKPLEMNTTRYVSALRPDNDHPIDDAIATEWCTYRQRVSVGIVHDENTLVMGGVSGHAGAFSTAPDMLRFAKHMLAIDQGDHTDTPPIVSQESVHFCWSEAARGADGHHLGGWDTPSGQRTSVGRGFGRETTVGHLGFTGTSLWIDRQARAIAILLTNRVHPSRENPRILDLRIDFHEAFRTP